MGQSATKQKEDVSAETRRPEDSTSFLTICWMGACKEEWFNDITKRNFNYLAIYKTPNQLIAFKINLRKIKALNKC